MEIALKLIVVATLLVLSADATPVPKDIVYANKPGQPSNIHYIENSQMSDAKECKKKSKEKKCQTAEIIKVPIRHPENDCPKNHKKDARGRCRLVWR